MWGTLEVLLDREGADVVSPTLAELDTLSNSNTWGFGQVIPVVLLILPFLSFLEVGYGERSSICVATSLGLVQCTNFVSSIEIFYPPIKSGLTSAHHSNVSHAPYQSNNSLLVQGQIQHYNDFYEHRWFRKLILLIYGLSLGLAGNMLWQFPYSRGFQYNDFQSLAPPYVLWLGYDIGVIWIFTTASLFLLYVEPTAGSTGTISPLERIERRIMPLARSRWIFSAAWNVLLLLLLGSSAGLGYYIFAIWDEIV